MDLDHNYHELTAAQRLQYWLWYRRSLDPLQRFFFEGHRATPGQMYRRERQELYGAVIARRPRRCYEIGTGAGGGSTFFLASAFRALGSGRLISLEASEAAWLEARRRYAGPLRHLSPFIDLLRGGSPRAFLPHIEETGSVVDCFFLDGSNTPEESVDQYGFFLEYSAAGTVLLAHDWDGGKMSALRPHIEADSRWRLKVRLREPESVGFVVYEFAGS